MRDLSKFPIGPRNLYKCDYCKREYVRRDTLKNHLKKKHTHLMAKQEEPVPPYLGQLLEREY